MWDLAVREEDYAKADSLLRRKFTPDKLPMGHRAIMAIVRGDSAARAQLLTRFRQKSSGFFHTSLAIALHVKDFATAREVARAVLDAGRPQTTRDSVHLILASFALAEGRWSEAKQEFAKADATNPSARRSQALAATLPFLVVSRPDLIALRTELEQWNPSADPPVPNPGLTSVLRPHLRLYLLGLLSSRLGEDTRALRYADALESADRPAETGMLIRDLSRTIRADVAARRGQSEEALELLERVRGEVPAELLLNPFFSEEGSRFLRAELLYQLGRDREALRWFANAWQGTPSELLFRAPAHLRQGELYERLGEREKSVEHYGRFIELWKSCDPELRPSVERARARMAALLGEPR
jgi:tetratricopeptide (TPR) repeat protein